VVIERPTEKKQSLKEQTENCFTVSQEQGHTASPEVTIKTNASPLFPTTFPQLVRSISETAT